VSTISSDNIHKQLNTQSYNIGLPNYAQISTLMEIVCVVITWFSLSQRTALSPAGLRVDGPMVSLPWDRVCSNQETVQSFPKNCVEFGGVVC